MRPVSHYPFDASGRLLQPHPTVAGSKQDRRRREPFVPASSLALNKVARIFPFLALCHMRSP